MPALCANSDLEEPDSTLAAETAGPYPFIAPMEPGPSHLRLPQTSKRRGGRVGGSLLHRQRAYAVKVIGVADDFPMRTGLRFLTTVRRYRRRATHGKPGQDRSRPHRPIHRGRCDGALFRLPGGRGRSADAIADGRWRDAAFIRPKLGEIDLAALTAAQLRRWRDDLARAAPRLRTKSGQKQKHKALDGAGEDEQRARRSSADRIWTTLRAALNHAFAENKVASAAEWKRVKPFKGVDAARYRYPQMAEVSRLVNACDPDFRLLMQAALWSGARYGQLAKLKVQISSRRRTVLNADPQGRRLAREHHITLNEDGAKFFRRLRAGLAGGEIAFERRTALPGQNRNKSGRWMTPSNAPRLARRSAFTVCGIRGPRRCYERRPAAVVAKIWACRYTDVERHYGHLAPGDIADAIKAGAPRFKIKPSAR